MWPFGKSIAQRAQEAIDSMNVFQGLGLRVSEQNGVLSVSGAVPNKNYLRAIEAAVGGIKGIQSVDTSGVIVAQQEVSDADIAQAEEEVRRATESSALAKQVLAALEANGELKDDPIDVLQKGSGVVLRGAVDSQHEFNLAVQLAKSAGATDVDTQGLQVHPGAKAKFATQQSGSGYTNVPDEWYTVQPGDTLSQIALKFYGDSSRESYMKIAKANNIQDPDLIRVGQKLQIPR